MPPNNQVVDKKSIDWRFVFRNVVYFLVLLYLLLAGSRGELIAREVVIFWINLFLILVLALVWAQKTLQARIEIIDSSPIYLFMAFTGTGLVSILVNQSFWKSITDLFVWGTAILGLLFFQLMRRSWKQIDLLDPILVIGAVLNTGKIMGFIRWVIDWIQYLPGQYQYLFRYRGVSPNVSSAFANIIFITALTQILDDKESRTKWIYYYTSFTALAVIMISGSRGGMIAFVAGLCAVFLIRFFVKVREKQVNQKRIRLFFTGIVMVGFLAIGVIYHFSKKSGRVGLTDRFEYWEVAVKSWKNNPWFGSGINTIGREILSIRSVPPVQLHTHAHNLFLNLLSEVGILGLSIFLGFVGYLVYQYFQDYKKRSTPASLGALGMITAILAHGFVDTLYIEPFLLFTYLMIFGITVPKGRKIDSIGIGAVNIFLCGLIGIGLFLGIHKSKYERALDSAENGYFEQAAVQMGNILDYSKENAFIQQQSGIFLSYLAEQESNPVRRKDYLIASIQAFENAVKLEPEFGGHHANLGILYWEIGKSEQALAHLTLSTELAPESIVFRLNSGVVFEEAGQLSEAREYYGWLLDKGFWLDSSFWKESQFRQRLFYNYQKQKWIEHTNKDDVFREEEKKSRELSIRDKIRSIEDSIEKNQIESAYFAWNQLKMQLGKSKVLAVEMQWLEAALAAAKGDLSKAVKIGSEAVENLEAKSSVGAGGIGYTDYGLRFYRSSAFSEDMVPFVKTAPVTETWERRLPQLENWKEKIQIDLLQQESN